MGYVAAHQRRGRSRQSIGVVMREQLEKRLEQLKAEFEAGQKRLVELEAKQANVRETLLCIGAEIQITNS